jgi:hypothetical protein
MRPLKWLAVAAPFLLLSFMSAQTARDPAKDREAIIALEQEWLHASDAATLYRILASDFVHVVPVDHFLTSRSILIGPSSIRSQKTGILSSTS